MITQDKLKELLTYSPDTGVFVWMERSEGAFKTTRAWRTWNTRFAGKVAGYLDSRYIKITIFGQPYLAHRLVWLFVYGYMPLEVDHKNHIAFANELSNLREATRQQNAQNRSRNINNESGVTGVRWNKKDRLWRATIRHNRKEVYLGSFTELLDAATTRKAAEIEYGFYPNHGAVKPVSISN